MQMRRFIAKTLVSMVALLHIATLSGCSGSKDKDEKCSWGGVCSPGEVCHDETEQCVLKSQVEACRDKSDYDTCSYAGSPPGTACRQGICIVPQCGDSIIDPGEDCEGENLGGAICESLGLGEGTLECNADCTFDTSGCELGLVCGNNLREGDEVCDGEDLAGETCVTKGFYGGTLGCLADCSDFDTSGCAGYCGDGVINGAEVCDGSSLGGETCESLGYQQGGVLACLEDCTDFDTAGCEGGYCGDGVINGEEVCDGEDLGEQTCKALGFDYGELACLPDCTGFDTSGCLEPECPTGFVFIPAGNFEMGCNDGDPCWEGMPRESPRHTVMLSAYCMMRTQVSVAQYRECKVSGGCSGTPTETSSDNSWCNWSSTAADREDHPINCINWSEAREYCQWVGGDLPTEAQWEKGARGTDGRTYPWGEEEPTCDRCNWNYSSFGLPYGCHDADEGPGTWPVGYLTTTAGDSPYGLKDMSGNLREWALDCYDEDFYATCAGGCTDPVNNLESCSDRITRGGSFNVNWKSHFRTVHRDNLFPTGRTFSVGFRCVATSVE